MGVRANCPASIVAVPARWGTGVLSRGREPPRPPRQPRPLPTLLLSGAGFSQGLPSCCPLRPPGPPQRRLQAGRGDGVAAGTLAGGAGRDPSSGLQRGQSAAPRVAASRGRMSAA